MSGMVVLWKILSHLGHFFSTSPANYSDYDSELFMRFYCPELLMQYSQKLAKQFCWLQATAFHMIWLQMKPKMEGELQVRCSGQSLDLTMKLLGMPLRNIFFYSQKRSLSVYSKPYFLQVYMGIGQVDVNYYICASELITLPTFIHRNYTIEILDIQYQRFRDFTAEFPLYYPFSIVMMRAIHIEKYGRTPILTACSLPTRNRGQYLIKMKYAPINPSDLNFYTGSYGVRKENFPIMGFEGSGVVQQCDDAALRGRKVSVLANLSNGTYANYMVSNFDELIFWPASTTISDDQLSMYSINPLSVMGFIDFINTQKSDTIVLSAAASNVNKMIAAYFASKYKNKTILGLSRSQKYDQQLKKIGFKHVYRMEQIDELKKELINHGKTVFFDCVGGNFAGQVFNILPPNSTMINYGRLSKQNLGSIDLSQLYFKNKFIRGFWLNTFLSQIDAHRFGEIKNEIIDNAGIFKQKIRQICLLSQFVEATRLSIKDQSEGKVLFDLSE